MMPNRGLENPVFFLPNLADALPNLGLRPRPRQALPLDPGFYPPGVEGCRQYERTPQNEMIDT